MDLTPGDATARIDLHEAYGGRRQGGISPSRQTPNVFLFTDPSKGLVHGYLYDGWRDDDYYHYTGEGQYGDQRMVQGNRAIRDHRDEGRDLHVFEVSKGSATYLGPFEYVDDYQVDAPETGDGPVRKVIVFRLRPLGSRPGPSRSKLDQLDRDLVSEVGVEAHLTETTLVEPDRKPYEVERREQALVVKLKAELLRQGHEVCRLQFRPRGEPAPLFCDLFDKTTGVFFEAKGSVSRGAIRMALGQLADYARFPSPPPTKAVLVPEEPRPDLLALAASENVTVVWPLEDDYVNLNELVAL